ncbi:hypothetical protein AB1285_15640 [Microbacterium sp. NRRL B-14842]|uniref:hypothetical protein n=1 Tax=Microbacterium sp. NRRL B-14842 TaxID=3162881 RepID=UPI003513FBD3
MSSRTRGLRKDRRREFSEQGRCSAIPTSIDRWDGLASRGGSLATGACVPEELVTIDDVDGFKGAHSNYFADFRDFINVLRSAIAFKRDGEHEMPWLSQ